MKPTAVLLARSTAVCCRVAAHACIHIRPDELPALRRNPGPRATELLSASFLKHAEEQSLAGIAAVLRAIAAAGWPIDGYADWGVVAAANFLGRAGIAQTVQRYAQEGAWGVAPNLIPHHSLHAVSGTVSQALKIHGPNFGVGGGPESGPDAFLVAATIASDNRLPGLWLILTGHECESIPEQGANAPALVAVALALVHERAPTPGLCLRIGLDAAGGPDHTALPDFTLDALRSELDQQENPSGRWSLGTLGWVELEILSGVESVQ